MNNEEESLLNNPGFKIQISNATDTYYDQSTAQKSNSMMLNDNFSKENGASRQMETISDRKEINSNSSYNNDLNVNETSNNDKKLVTSIVIEKTNGNKISEIKVKYNKEKDGDILIKFSNNKNKLDKLKPKKANSKLKLDDQRNSIIGKNEKIAKNINNINKKDKDNESPIKEYNRFDFYGNQIIKHGKHKVYIKPDIDIVKIKSHKGALNDLNKEKVKCDCACVIF
jgi:hypothetical protein